MIETSRQSFELLGTCSHTYLVQAIKRISLKTDISAFDIGNKLVIVT